LIEKGEQIGEEDLSPKMEKFLNYFPTHM